MERVNRIIRICVTPSMAREINERVATLAHDHPEVSVSSFVRMVLRAYLRAGQRNVLERRPGNVVRAQRARAGR